ncbi:MAG: 50S ribosomal protein L18 [Bacteroidota bacterium]|nr:50S ribosomal protein L18 [Bacteroidota bacterium]MDE2835638.1 50S ribosomal protein L18 [Bacteroidota bacterium]MDE2956416.1 50S ribosomal protein L18 [Bacteroidota bacterium]
MASRKPGSARIARRLRTKRSIRKKVSGTADRPRLTVFRSNRNIYAQLIDDLRGHTLASASTLEEGHDAPNPLAAGTLVGEKLAERARAKGITNAIFDRNGYRYHGRVKSLAEGARKGGLVF